MTYDIYFVRREPGQSFEDALESTEAEFDGDPGGLTTVEHEQWDRILPLARRLLGDVEEFGDRTTRELLDPATGVQLALMAGEASIAVRPGADVDAVLLMEKVYSLARIVERETGLEGYDPQLGAPVSQQRASEAGGARFTAAAASDAGDDRRPGGMAGRGTDQPVATAPADAPARAARWWEFWKP